MTFNAVIPEGCKEDIPVVYLLHGLSDDHTMWCRRTSAERYADKYGIALIMPNADRSFYTDMKYGGKYYSYISDELVEYTRDLFHLSHKREKNFMCGLSMGGYGALKIAFKNPEKYEAVAAFSAVADIVHQIEIEQWPADMINIFSPEMIVVGGGISKEGDYLLDPVREKIKTRVFGIGLLPDRKIVAAQLGNDAGIIGAALLHA